MLIVHIRRRGVVENKQSFKTAYLPYMQDDMTISLCANLVGEETPYPIDFALISYELDFKACTW